MSYLKIVADEEITLVKCSGDALDCLDILGGATTTALAHISEKLGEKDPNKLVCFFCESVKAETQKKLGLVPVPRDRKEEACGEHVCRCQKASEEERNPTLEELAEMIGKLDAGKLQRLSALIMKNAVDSLATDEKPKEAGSKERPLDGFSLGVF